MLLKNRPVLKKISPSFGSSILVKQHTEKRKSKFKTWHFHPEIELVYVNKGEGKRHIGNHLSYFNNSQLILIGANLPHNGFTDRLTAKGIETVIQFSPTIFGNKTLELPEMNAILSLLDRAKMGILFKPETKKIVGPKILKLEQSDGLNRFAKLLEILDLLARSRDYELLNADGYAFEIQQQDSDKIDIIYKYVNEHFQDHIKLAEMADKVSMTVPAFCRYFKKVTGKTFTKLVNEFRIVHATKLLSESKSSITDICFECGFNNFSHFNNQFKEFTGKSASNYRKEIKLIIQS